MQPVPIGVAGELYIGGASLARGYLKRPQLTAEKFVADPFSDAAGARLYRTGDRVRYRPDGAIEFLGRFDHQVKLRGFRIELGEIEAVLAKHPAVTAAVATVCEDVESDRRLLAYAISESPPAAADIREFMRQRLPDYMVPAEVMWVDMFPLTANGKIDIKALPAPPRTREITPAKLVAPRGEFEIAMAHIWEELLDVDEVHANDTFYDLGGHSLLSLKVVERFERETAMRINPVELVNQTLRQLVSSIEARSKSAVKPGAKNRRPRLLDSIKKAFSKGT